MAIQVRFIGGGEHYEALTMDSAERSRFEAEWRRYLSGGRIRGGTYLCSEAGRTYEMSIRFESVAAIHFARP